MKIAILSLAGAMALSASGALAANTCAPIKHKVVHRVLARHAVARRVRVLADAAEPGYAIAERSSAPVYERGYVEGPPVYYEGYAPYPGPYGPAFIGYGPRWHGGYGWRRGWGRRW
jgi:hypothetical protein